jgi:hypothetical protein
MGKKLGLLPDDYVHVDEPTPSHTPDKHVATVAEPVQHGHSVDDETFDAPRLTSAYRAAIAAAEAT